ncbi:MAG TPA: YggS family pyridoxal phosphate-dependent enzyme [Clostridiales bacterium]|nr:YggS family pyridoxal phosphate-dependent enzyme [Clostridiales bacterium]
MDIKQNIDLIHQRIKDVLLKTGRRPDDVTLVGVTKNIPVDIINHAVSHGLLELGENRVQELVEKHELISGVRWHMIGRLQRNKVKYIVDKVALIHSLDSLSLAREINRHAERIQRVVPVLVQVNAANEETKAGLPFEETIPFIESIYNLKFIKVMGLMLIAPLTDDPETVRPYFRAMKQLFDNLKENDYPHTDIKYLSMGMTNDFEVAIEEGSNMVRIGTAIFGKREKGE